MFHYGTDMVRGWEGENIHFWKFGVRNSEKAGVWPFRLQVIRRATAWKGAEEGNVCSLFFIQVPRCPCDCSLIIKWPKYQKDKPFLMGLAALEHTCQAN